MNRLCVALILILGALVPGLLGADELSQAGVAQLTRMVECMKAFDAECVNGFMYTRPFEKKGMDVSKPAHALKELYANLTSIGAKYSRFDLQDPGSTFTGDGQTFVFVPYSSVLEGGGRRVLQEAFFIGASEDQGKTWRFMDGISVTQENIRMIIPSYSGAPLPDRRMKPLDQ
jgi:hypothetical protein